MEYEDLIRLSTKGDKLALEALFQLAERLSLENRYEDASKVFRESAISYRIAAFRESGIAQSQDNEVNWLSEELKYIKRWIEQNPTGLRMLPRKIDGISEKYILEVMRDEIWHDDQLGSLIQLLESALEKSGMQFYSPGGSSLRKIISLMCVYFGLNDFGAASLEILEVRILMDLLADEVEKKFSMHHEIK